MAGKVSLIAFRPLLGLPKPGANEAPDVYAAKSVKSVGERATFEGGRYSLALPFDLEKVQPDLVARWLGKIPGLVFQVKDAPAGVSVDQKNTHVIGLVTQVLSPSYSWTRGTAITFPFALNFDPAGSAVFDGQVQMVRTKGIHYEIRLSIYLPRALQESGVDENRWKEILSRRFLGLPTDVDQKKTQARVGSPASHYTAESPPPAQLRQVVSGHVNLSRPLGHPVNKPDFLDEAPSYAALQGMADLGNDHLGNLLHKFYGDPWPGLLRQWRRSSRGKAREVEGLSYEEVASRFLKVGAYSVNARRLSDLEEWHAGAPIPEKALVDALALVMGLDPSILYFGLNEKNLGPEVDRQWTEGPGYELYLENTGLVRFVQGFVPLEGLEIKSDLRHRVLVHYLDPNSYKPKKVKDFRVPRENDLRDLLRGNETLQRSSVEVLAAMARVEEGEVHDFVMRQRFPELPGLLKKAGFPNARFIPSAASDSEKMAYYFEGGHYQKLGFALWVDRNARGRSTQQRAKACRVNVSRYNDLEWDRAGGWLDWKVLHRLQAVASVPMEALALTYPHLSESDSSDSMGEAGTNPVRQALGASNQAAARLLAEAEFERVTGRTTSFSQVAMSAMIAAFDSPNKKLATDCVPFEAMAAWTLAFSEKGHQGRVWARVYDEERKLFPDLEADVPILKVPAGFDFEHVLYYSVPEKIEERMVKDRMNAAVAATELGFAEGKIADRYRSMDFGLVNVDRAELVAKFVGDDPRVVFLAKNPWFLLAARLADDKGKLLGLEWTPDTLRELAKSIAKKQKEEVRGPAMVQAALEAAHLDNPLKLQDAGISIPASRILLNSENRLVDAHLYEALKIPKIDRARLIEGYRLGELRLFMGTRDGGKRIDWSFPDEESFESISNLDLMKTAQSIWGKFRKPGESFGKFWKGQPGFHDVAGESNFYRKMAKGFSPDEIHYFHRKARETGEAHATLKHLYLYFNGPFLANFVDIHDAHGHRFEALPPGHMPAYRYKLLARAVGRRGRKASVVG